MSEAVLPVLCPNCNGEISLGKGNAYGTKIGWSCAAGCGAFSFCEIEHPDVTKGREIASDFKNIHCLDRRVTTLPGLVQIGILRENQRELTALSTQPESEESE